MFFGDWLAVKSETPEPSIEPLRTVEATLLIRNARPGRNEERLSRAVAVGVVNQPANRAET